MADYSHSPKRSSSRDPRAQRYRRGTDRDLLSELRSLDGGSYGAYKRIVGSWDFGSFTVHVDRAQADPYAPPSAIRVTATPQTMGLPPESLTKPDQRLATADFLVRTFGQVLKSDGRFAALSIVGTGQEILERSAAAITDESVELRVQVRLPARGRTILGREAREIFDVLLPDAVGETFDFVSDHTADYRARLLRHVEAFEDHRALQQALVANGWVAFVANESVLARRSGVSELPLTDAVPFRSPDSLLAEVTLPHAGQVTGMALPPGITVIVGGGYHGKSTVLSALQRAVYPHVPGDGRELVATVPSAMKIRAADGRPITKVDVSPFIANLPNGADTARFSTQNASGSTSQAASIIESLQAGSPLLLIDEDTSATNLMIRDSRMRQLVSDSQEPITPLVDRIRALPASVVLVMGGSSDYLDVADLVLQMDAYQCLDITDRARQVVAASPREQAEVREFPELAPRVPLRRRGGGDKAKTKTAGLDRIDIDRQSIDVSDVEQIVDPGQTEAIAWALRGLLQELANARQPLTELAAELDERLDREGLDGLCAFGARRFPAFLARPRAVDLLAAVNRLRDLGLV